MVLARRLRPRKKTQLRGFQPSASERERLTALAVTAERNRIAREMHDIVAHNLSVMVALTDGAELTLDRDPKRAREAIHQAAETGRIALTEMRNTIALLRSGPEDAQPPAWAPGPSLKDVETLLETARSTGLHVTYKTTGSTDGLSVGLQLALFRLVQESITNTLKHAPRATRLQVSVRRGQEDLRVLVADNGGVVPPTREFGQGLIGMQERVSLYDGRLFAGPTTGGWRVSVWLPLPDRGGRQARP